LNAIGIEKTRRRGDKRWNGNEMNPSPRTKPDPSDGKAVIVTHIRAYDQISLQIREFYL
jgi:hypothetical protein